MVEEVTHTKYKSFIIDQLLTKTQCREFMDIIDQAAENETYYQEIKEMSELSDHLWSIIRDNLPRRIIRENHEFILNSHSNKITMSRHQSRHIKIHKDNNKDNNDLSCCIYKLAIYLNNLSRPEDPNDCTGGTYFYFCKENKNISYRVKPEIGRAILFDIREWHSGSPLPPNSTKYMLGVRIIYKKIIV